MTLNDFPAPGLWQAAFPWLNLHLPVFQPPLHGFFSLYYWSWSCSGLPCLPYSFSSQFNLTFWNPLLMFLFSVQCLLDFAAVYLYKGPGVSMEHRPSVMLCEVPRGHFVDNIEKKVCVSDCRFIPTQWGCPYAAVKGSEEWSVDRAVPREMPQQGSILKKQCLFCQKQQHAHSAWASCSRPSAEKGKDGDSPYPHGHADGAVHVALV